MFGIVKSKKTPSVLPPEISKLYQYSTESDLPRGRAATASCLVYFKHRISRSGRGPTCIKPEAYLPCHYPLNVTDKKLFSRYFVDVVLHRSADDAQEAWVDFLLDVEESPFGPHLKTLPFYRRLDKFHVAFEIPERDPVVLAWTHWVRRAYEQPAIVHEWHKLVQEGYPPRIAAMLTATVYRARAYSRGILTFDSGHNLMISWTDQMTENFVTQKTTSVHEAAGKVFCGSKVCDRNSIRKLPDPFAPITGEPNRKAYLDYIEIEGARLEEVAKQADKVLRTDRILAAKKSELPPTGRPAVPQLKSSRRVQI